MIPKGLQLLQGERQTEQDTIAVLNECCADHPNGCGRYRKECRKLFAIRSDHDPRSGGWAWSLKSLYKVPAQSRQADDIRYSNTLPILKLKDVRTKIREGVIGGML